MLAVASQDLEKAKADLEVQVQELKAGTASSSGGLSFEAHERAVADAVARAVETVKVEAAVAHAQAAASAEAVDVSELSPVLEQAVLRLASERAGLAIHENPQGLVQRIEHLVEKVKSWAKAISVTLNPDDLKAVDTWRPATSAHSAWTWRADASFASGDIQLKLDGITVTDLLGADTDIRPAERAESPVSAPTPSPEMQAEEELPEQPIEELQAEQPEETPRE